MVKILLAMTIAACTTQQSHVTPAVPLAGSAFDVGGGRPPLWGAKFGEVCVAIADAACADSSSVGCRSLLEATCCGGSPLRPSCTGVVVAPTQAAWDAGWSACRDSIENGDGSACFSVAGAVP